MLASPRRAGLGTRPISVSAFEQRDRTYRAPSSSTNVVRNALQRSATSPSPSSSPSLARCRRCPSLAVVSTTKCRVKLTESFDAHLHLEDQQRDALFSVLGSPEFCARVSLEATGATRAVEFEGKVFVPVPWSPSTKKGMPPEYEVYAEDKENYVVINVPAPVMFKANILGKRCCAIYRIAGVAE